MMSRFGKIQNNLLSARIPRVLGPLVYSVYLARFAMNLPGILRAGRLNSLDKAMGKIARRFHYRGSTILFDCEFCDRHLDEGSFAFGIVREMYIRDCYLKWQPPFVYENARTVVDLGANRGAFSTLMTARATFILSVECGPQYAAIIKHNVTKNAHRHFAVETAFVGAGGTADSNGPRLTVQDLLHMHNLQTVDLMKMDIEGSEFALFEAPDWLNRVKAISMEVHHDHGDPDRVLGTLNRFHFSTMLANENLNRVSDPKQATFLYAWKNS
jgi:hypothetical protein